MSREEELKAIAEHVRQGKVVVLPAQRSPDPLPSRLEWGSNLLVANGGGAFIGARWTRPKRQAP